MLIRLLLVFLFGCCGQLFAQTADVPADTTRPKKKTIKVNVIDPKGKKKIVYAGEPMNFDSVQKAVKLDPVLLVRGEFTVFFEWRLHDRFSVEGGLGLTYIDLTYELFENNGRFLRGGEEGKNVQFHTGFSTRAQLRYFPSRYETAITGFYIAGAWAYRTWRMEYYVNNGLVSVPYDVKRGWNEFRIQIGEQDPDPYSVVFTEWYLNFGVQFRENDHVRGHGINTEIYHTTESRLVLGAGVKIGFVL
jgi:hypothetical protein